MPGIHDTPYIIRPWGIRYRVSCTRYRLLRFYFRFPAFLGGGFCYSVISSRRYTPPRGTCEPEVCVFPLRAVFFLALLMLIYLHFIFSSFPFSISIWTSLVSSCLFLVGNMLSPRFRFLLRDSFTILRVSYICILIRTYADLTFFIFVWGIRFVPVIVCIIFCFYSISS